MERQTHITDTELQIIMDETERRKESIERGHAETPSRPSDAPADESVDQDIETESPILPGDH
jgi:hypothetical protein